MGAVDGDTHWSTEVNIFPMIDRMAAFEARLLDVERC